MQKTQTCAPQQHNKHQQSHTRHRQALSPQLTHLGSPDVVSGNGTVEEVRAKGVDGGDVGSDCYKE